MEDIIVKRSKRTFTENGYLRISEAAGLAVAKRAWKLIRGVGGEGQRLLVGGEGGGVGCEGCGEVGLPRPQAEPCCS